MCYLSLIQFRSEFPFVTTDLLWLEHKYQKLKKGFCCCEIWNLDVVMAKFILPRIEHFYQNDLTYPGELTEEEWDRILHKIIFSLDAVANEDIPYWLNNSAEIQEGLDLFGKYFQAFWC